MASSSVLNFNVGVLGHVDSGKTSLAKAISTVSSTAAFDKNPQSQVELWVVYYNKPLKGKKIDHVLVRLFLS